MAVSGQCVLGLTQADQICIMYLMAFATLATHPFWLLPECLLCCESQQRSGSDPLTTGLDPSK